MGRRVAVMLARIRPYAPTVILGMLIFYFGFQALTGDRGLLATQHRQETLQARKQELAELQQKRHNLEVRARLLDNRSLSADLLEERARTLLGFVGPNDYVIRVPANG
jgi:cell division protein FtsB